VVDSDYRFCVGIDWASEARTRRASWTMNDGLWLSAPSRTPVVRLRNSPNG